MAEPHPSNSMVQQELELHVRGRAALQLGIDPDAVAPRRVEVGGAVIALDGWHASPRVALEVFACVGRPKGGQKHKLRADMLKLALVRRDVPVARLVVVVTSVDAASWLRSGWNAEVLREFKIEVLTVELTPQEQALLDGARALQRLGNRALDEQ